MSEDVERCPDCGHLIRGDELKERRYHQGQHTFAGWKTNPESQVRCKRCQQEHDREEAIYYTGNDPTPDELADQSADKRRE